MFQKSGAAVQGNELHKDTVYCDEGATQIFCYCQNPTHKPKPVLLFLPSSLHSENQAYFTLAASRTALESIQGYEIASLKDV